MLNIHFFVKNNKKKKTIINNYDLLKFLFICLKNLKNRLKAKSPDFFYNQFCYFKKILFFK